MALFRRKNNQVSSDPYYSNQRSNKPMAWLLAVVTFIVTLLIILGLFFAGRWVWRHTFGDDNSDTSSTTQTEEGTENSPTVDGNVPNSSESNKSQGQAGSENQTQQGNQNSNQSGQTQGSSTQGTNNAPQTSSTSTSVPSQAPTGAQPNTGPTENMLAVFVITSVLGFIVHKKWLSKQ